jgi:riboflavin biosynthesis pyrimidine reductase
MAEVLLDMAVSLDGLVAGPGDAAKKAAGGSYVTIGGGADIARQCLVAGLVDELRLHLVPLILGKNASAFSAASISRGA